MSSSGHTGVGRPGSAYRPGIQAAAQVRTNRNITHKLAGHGLSKKAVELLEILIIIAAGRRLLESKVPVPADVLDAAPRSDLKRGPSWQ